VPVNGHFEVNFWQLATWFWGAIELFWWPNALLIPTKGLIQWISSFLWLLTGRRSVHQYPLDLKCFCCKRRHSKLADSEHTSSASSLRHVTSASSRDGGDEYSSEASELDTTKNVSALSEISYRIQNLNTKYYSRLSILKSNSYVMVCSQIIVTVITGDHTLKKDIDFNFNDLVLSRTFVKKLQTILCGVVLLLLVWDHGLLTLTACSFDQVLRSL